MDTLLGLAVVGVWIAISVVALTRAYGSRGPSSSPKRQESCIRAPILVRPDVPASDSAGDHRLRLSLARSLATV
jgi:hypothetical protein